MSSDELPPHITPEYIEESRAPLIIGVIISVSVLSTIFVLARIFTRTRLTGSMFLDDYLVMIAAVRPDTAATPDGSGSKTNEELSDKSMGLRRTSHPRSTTRQWQTLRRHVLHRAPEP